MATINNYGGFYSTELYGLDGQITSDASREGSIPFDPKDLLFDDVIESVSLLSKNEINNYIFDH